MIQLIGIMMGVYIFTRLLEIATSATANWAVKIVAVLALLVDIACVFGLMVTNIPPGLR